MGKRLGGHSMQLDTTRDYKKSCSHCKYLKANDYCSYHNRGIRSNSRGSCANFKKREKELKKVKCTDCRYFKFGYYCDKRKHAATNINKNKICSGFKKGK